MLNKGLIGLAVSMVNASSFPPPPSYILTCLQEDLLLACEDVRSKGETLHSTGSIFVQDTTKLEKRANMVRAARDLLFSITRLMVLADIIDVQNLLDASSKVRFSLLYNM